VCIALCTTAALNTAQNRLDNFPSYPPDNHHCYNDVYLKEGQPTSTACILNEEQMQLMPYADKLTQDARGAQHNAH